MPVGRVAPVPFIVNAGDNPTIAAIGFEAYGAYYLNASQQWLQVGDPPQGDWVPPSSRGTVALYGSPSVALRWAAPSGTSQPAAVVGQQCYLRFTEKPLDTTGGSLLGTQISAVTQLSTNAKSALPALGNSGRMVLLTDYDRSVWLEGATPDIWTSLSYEIFDPKKFGCKFDGSTTDTVNFQACMDQAGLAGLGGSGGSLIIMPPGRTKLDTITWRSGVGILGYGAFASQILQASDAGGHHVLVPENGAVDLTIEGVGFVGVGGAGGNTYAIAAGNNGTVDRLHIDRCRFTAFSAGGVQWGAPTTGLVSDSSVDRCHFIDNAINVGQPPGIAITNARRCRVRATTIERSGADRSFAGANYGIDMEPNVDADIIEDITIESCTIRNCGAGGIQTLARATAPNQTKNIEIHGGSIFGHANDGLLLGQNGARGMTLMGINIHDNGRMGVRFFGSDARMEGCRVIDNNRAGSASQHIDIAANRTDVQISGNRIGYVLFTTGAAIPAVLENAGCDFNTIVGNDLRNIPAVAVSLTLVGNSTRAHDNVGWNPRTTAIVSPAVPATTVAQRNTFNVDCNVTITAPAATVTVAIDAVSVGVMPASSVSTFRIPVNSTITLTYAAGAPTWVWSGD